MLRDKALELYNQVGSLIEFIDKNPKYDLSMFELKSDCEDLNEGIFDLKNKIRYEINWQKGVIKYCAQKTLQDCPSSGYNKTSIKYYENYYVVEIFGFPFKRRSFIVTRNNTDKKFVILDSISFNEGCINAIDRDSYFIVYKNKDNEFYKARHCKFGVNLFERGFVFSPFENRIVLDNVCSVVMPVSGQKLDVELGENLVSWICDYEEDRTKDKFVLYNHKKSEVMVPEYTDIKIYEKGRNLFEVTNKIEIANGLVVELKFLVDDRGFLNGNVWDSTNNQFYGSDFKWDFTKQSDKLKTLFDEIKNNSIKKDVKTLERKK